MLAESLVTLASGGAVAVAAGTDVWLAFRNRAGRLLGRRDAGATTVVPARSDRSGTEGEAADAADVDRVRARVAGAWQGRFEDHPPRDDYQVTFPEQPFSDALH
ncbi:hypothetical protein EHYA_08399 [Embleya hyalina]|uniref:Uncharacterized protein n=1 Tax=Embleya hyalina TaxID=516124 RepID=A0A401Z181_9ACTN|nr:hypothetical protein EHYA_08399 [Embleya hyalina]